MNKYLCNKKEIVLVSSITNTSSLIGKLINSRYEIQEVLIIGEFSTIYKALDKTNGMNVIIKLSLFD